MKAFTVMGRTIKAVYEELFLCVYLSLLWWLGTVLIVTAAPDHLPAPLMQQLADGGRLLIPIGPTGGYQTMWKFVKEGAQIKAYNLGNVVFVPLVSEGSPQPYKFQTKEEE